MLEHLEGVEGGAGQFSAWCPCHDDIGTAVKGLSITLRPDGKLLVKCHSCGATLTAVVDTLENGNGYNEEFKVNVHKIEHARTRASGMTWWVNKTGVPEGVWHDLGCESDGAGVAFFFDETTQRKIRKPPKEIVWKEKNADTPPLWPIPGEELPEHVWIVEGESDCGTARHAGHYAFAVTKGAGTDLPANWASEFKQRGVAQITLAFDADSSGEDARKKIEKQAIDAALMVHVVHLDLVLDPFTGANDLNALYHYYGQDVVELNKAVEHATHTVSSRFPKKYGNQSKIDSHKEVKWILNGLIRRRDKILISGPQKSYKTWIALDLARALIQQRPFLNRPEWIATEQHTILYVQEEGSEEAWDQRVNSLQLPEDIADEFISLHRHGVRFTDSSSIDAVISICREDNVDAVFFDPLQRMTPGIDENDSSATGIVWDEVFRLQFAVPNLIVVVVHHANKTERLNWESVRGSSRHGGEVDLGIFCQKADDNVRIAVDGRDIPPYLGTGDSFEAKIKISTDVRDPHLMLDATEMSIKLSKKEAEAAGSRDSIINAIASGAHAVEAILSVAEISRSTFNRRMPELIEQEKVVKVDNGPGKALTYELLEKESNGEDSS